MQRLVKFARPLSDRRVWRSIIRSTSSKSISIEEGNHNESLFELESRLTSVPRTPSEDDCDVGRIASIRSGGDCVHISGITNARLGSLLKTSLSPSTSGLLIVLALTKHHVVAAAVNPCASSLSLTTNDSTTFSEGEPVELIEPQVTVRVGERLLGTVVDALGRHRMRFDSNNYIDDHDFENDLRKPLHIFSPIPSTISRSSSSIRRMEGLDHVLWTNCKLVDALRPFAKGRRVALSSSGLMEQRRVARRWVRSIMKTSLSLRLIYVGVGTSLRHRDEWIASFKNEESAGDLQIEQRCVFVEASERDSTTLQFIAPFAAASIAESFRDAGHDVLIVYDNLESHAAAIKSLQHSTQNSLLPASTRSLHAQLLERAGRCGTTSSISVLVFAPSSVELPSSSVGNNEDAHPSQYVGSLVDDVIRFDSQLIRQRVDPPIQYSSLVLAGESKYQLGAFHVVRKLRLRLAESVELADLAQLAHQLEIEIEDDVRERFEFKSKINTYFQGDNELDLYEQLVSMYVAVYVLPHVSLKKIRDLESQILASLCTIDSTLMKELHESNLNEALSHTLHERMKAAVIECATQIGCF